MDCDANAANWQEAITLIHCGRTCGIGLTRSEAMHRPCGASIMQEVGRSSRLAVHLHTYSMQHSLWQEDCQPYLKGGQCKITIYISDLYCNHL